MKYRKANQPGSGLRCSAKYERNLLSNQIEMSDADGWRTKRRLIFLVHGYNVQISSAHRVLKYFEESVSARSRPCARLANDIAWFIWPGDMHGFGSLASVPFYPAVVKRAPKVGSLLGDFLGRRLQERENLEIILVAHSLGCRVVLEALAQLKKLSTGGTHASTSISIFLMAAAIPTKYLEQDGMLRPTLEGIRNSAVLYSNFDRALGLAFKLGQTFAPGESAGDAVGRVGEPREVFGTYCETRWGHSDYWKKAADTFVKWMGYSARSQIPRHKLGKWKKEVHRLPRYPGIN